MQTFAVENLSSLSLSLIRDMHSTFPPYSSHLPIFYVYPDRVGVAVDGSVQILVKGRTVESFVIEFRLEKLTRSLR